VDRDCGLCDECAPYLVSCALTCGSHTTIRNASSPAAVGALSSLPTTSARLPQVRLAGATAVASDVLLRRRWTSSTQAAVDRRLRRGDERPTSWQPPLLRAQDGVTPGNDVNCRKVHSQLRVVSRHPSWYRPRSGLQTE
jgi:hypothetical protein